MELNRIEWSSSNFDHGILEAESGRRYIVDRFDGPFVTKYTDIFGIYAPFNNGLRYVFKYKYSIHPFYQVLSMG